jgi:glycosyltransferase involved in cell wall biosynthesis
MEDRWNCGGEPGVLAYSIVRSSDDPLEVTLMPPVNPSGPPERGPQEFGSPSHEGAAGGTGLAPSAQARPLAARPLRVGIVVMAEPLEIDGSRPYRASLLANALADRGHCVTWWTSDFDHTKKQSRFGGDHVLRPRTGLTIHFLEGPGYSRNISLARLRHNAVVARRLAGMWKLQPPDLDLLFVSIPLHEMATVALAFAKSAGIPVVLDIRDPWPDVYLSILHPRIRPLGRVLLAREYGRAARNLSDATAIVAVSETYLRWGLTLAQRGARIDKVFPIGYPDRSLNQREVSTPSESQPDRVIAFAGTFGKGYDLETVIQAAKDLAASRSDVRWVLAGDGDNRGALSRLANGHPQVELVGWLNQGDLATLLARSALGLVAYSRNATQSLPNKVFEYLCAGLPVVSSLKGECAALIEHYNVGLNYRAGDPDSLREAISWLLNNPAALAEMSHNARQLFEDRYSASRIYSDLAAYLERIAIGGASETGTLA